MLPRGGAAAFDPPSAHCALPPLCLGSANDVILLARSHRNADPRLWLVDIGGFRQNGPEGSLVCLSALCRLLTYDAMAG